MSAEQEAETKVIREASTLPEDNIAANVPQLIDALQRTPYGEIRISMRAGRIVAIARTETILPAE
jgi:hypothetical protein